MILTGCEIKEKITSGKILISPFRESSINPNSYNYHLGAEIKTIPPGTEINPLSNFENNLTVMDKKGMILTPGNLYLGVTEEKIGSSSYVISLIGRSSIGRLGLFMQVSADLSNIGIFHRWTLELVPTVPIRVYPGIPIGQVSFWKPKGIVKKYSGLLGTLNEPSFPNPLLFNDDIDRS